ncbi:MAG: DNA polymerase III subunit gamma/tau [Clostridiaceae bacterium]|nr:DNA polymerase III subunit gamma/tau [Clostridiaceae bacterium]
MSYKALYRKWRPQKFEDVIGQDHITTTLKNQMKSENISHAYLFSGTRGTGKTSTAKIFARGINCLNPDEFNPCNECEVCKGILTENIMDVVEIDAASNNGVDHIRELRENVKYPPSKGKYKVYIIDEVHMLSSGAFNALLKTLEEPPQHVVFILATTDPQKLPATILSRCQRFDFKAVTTKDMMKRLATICNAMEIETEEEALRMIAINANGALRDALSILEQCISFSRGRLTYDEVIDTLGIVNYQFVFDLIQYISQKNTSKAIEVLQQIVGEGKDVQQLIKDLINHLRNLLMVKIKVDLEDQLQLSAEVLQKIKEQSTVFHTDDLVEYIHILSEAEAKAKYATQPKILLEVAIVSLCQEKGYSSLEDLAAKVRELESVLQGKTTELPVRNSIKKEQAKQESKEYEKIDEHKEKEQQKPRLKEAEVETEAISQTIETPQEPLDFDRIKNKWQEVLEFIRKDKKAQIQALLKEGELQYTQKNTLVISLKDGFGFHREALEKKKNKEYIMDVVEKITGEKAKISFVMEHEILPKERKEDEEVIIEKLKQVVPDHLLQIYDE